MLGAILQAIAGFANGAGKTIEEVGERIGAPQWITGGFSGICSAVGGASAAIDERLPTVSDARSWMGGIGHSLSSMLSGSFEPRQPEIQAPKVAPQIAASVQQPSRYDVSPADLGCFAAPNFGAGCMRGGAGMGM